jgi:hypothetical protein
MSAPKKESLSQRLSKHTMPFLAHLLQCSEDEAWLKPVTWQVFDDSPTHDPLKARVIHGNLKNNINLLEKHNEQGSGIFISVNETDLSGRKKENITAARSAWADLDSKSASKAFEPALLPLCPTMLVKSGHGHHPYWVYSKPIPLDIAGREAQAALLRGIQKPLAEIGADPKVCHVVSVLRVPGTYNMKVKAKPVLVELLYSDGPLYTPEEIAAIFPPGVRQPKAVAAPNSQAVVVGREGILAKAKSYAQKIDPAISGNGGHLATFTAALKLTSGFNLSAEETLEVMCEAYNPRCEPLWSEKELQHKVEGAYKLSIEEGNRGRLIIADDQAAARAEVRKVLVKDDHGHPRAIPANLIKILREDPQYGPRLSLNEMSLEICFDRRAQPDHFVIAVQEQLQDNYHLNFPEREIRSKLLAQAANNPFHPVREYLKCLPRWDGVERLTRVATEILGTEGSALYDTYLTKFFIAAVRRVLHPGCKVDTVLVLTGPQGAMKSSFFDVLGGEWFNDSPIDMSNKDGVMVLHRAWISELAEIDHATSSTVVERMKAFISSRKDIFRAPYAASADAHPRSCILVGTSNREAYLTDASGSRRFWTVKVSAPANLELLRDWRDQLWAEAVGLEHTGIDHWLGAEDEAAREIDAEQHECEDPLESKFLDWLEILKKSQSSPGKAGFDPMDGISTAKLMEVLDLPASQRGHGGSMRLSATLKKHGWEQRSRKHGGSRLWHPKVVKQVARVRK